MKTQPIHKNEKMMRNYCLLAFLAFLNILNFVDRQLIVSFSNFIVPDLGLTNTQYGLLTGFVFLAFYSVMGVFMGHLADNFSRTRLIAGALALWSLFTAASGMARGFVSLAIPRALISVGESTLAPASLSLLADRFPESKQGFAASLYYLGIPLGIGLSFIIAGQLGPLIGWRNCFYILGGIGVCMAVIMFLFKDTSRIQEQKHVHSADTKISLLATLRTIVMVIKGSSPLQFLLLGFVFVNLTLGAANFDQLWLVKERGFERAEIASLTGWLVVVAGTAGALLGAYGFDYCKNRFGIPRLQFLFWLTLLLIPLGFVLRIADPASIWFWLSFVGGMFYLGCYVGPFFVIVQELTPPHIRGAMIAFSMLVSNIIGLGFGNFLCGLMIDYFTNMHVSDPYTISLIIMAALGSPSVIFYYLAVRAYKHANRAIDGNGKNENSILTADTIPVISSDAGHEAL